MNRQIVFTENEWATFRRRISEAFVEKAEKEFRIVDRETNQEVAERLRDYCWGQMALMIDSATR